MLGIGITLTTILYWKSLEICWKSWSVEGNSNDANQMVLMEKIQVIQKVEKEMKITHEIKDKYNFAN